MKVQVERVEVELGSTTGFVFGRPISDQTKVVVAAADWRGAVVLGEALAQLDEPIVVDVPEWSIVRVLELPSE